MQKKKTFGSVTSLRTFWNKQRAKVERTLVLLRAGTDSSRLVESEEDASHHKDLSLEDHRVQAQVRSVASPVLAMAQ